MTWRSGHLHEVCPRHRLHHREGVAQVVEADALLRQGGAVTRRLVPCSPFQPQRLLIKRWPPVRS